MTTTPQCESEIRVELTRLPRAPLAATGDILGVLGEIAAHGRGPGPARAPLRWVRLVREIEPTGLLEWLSRQRTLSRLYWRSRDGGHEMAGAGIAHRIDSADFSAAGWVSRCAFPDDAGSPGVLVTARFAPTRTPGERWTAFGRVRAYVPEIEIQRHETTYTLAVNLVAESGDTGAAAARLRAAVDAAVARSDAALDRTATPRIERGGRGDSPAGAGARQWTDDVNGVLRRIADGTAEKVVLARVVVLENDAPIDPLAVLRALAAAEPGPHLFCVQLDPHRAFLGASPELLFRRRGRQVWSEALAGTRPRGATGDMDRKLAAELLESAKERREHELVAQHIRHTLGPLCAELTEAPAPVVRRFPSVQHISTAIEGSLLDETTDVDILSRLHPTPAVCGLPVEAALQEIAARETFDRGLYGGPVGWVGTAGAECAVALRCGLISGSEIRLYAGAGIVRGSDPPAEWAETEHKLGALRRVLQ